MQPASSTAATSTSDSTVPTETTSPTTPISTSTTSHPRKQAHPYLQPTRPRSHPSQAHLSRPMRTKVRTPPLWRAASRWGAVGAVVRQRLRRKLWFQPSFRLSCKSPLLSLFFFPLLRLDRAISFQFFSLLVFRGRLRVSVHSPDFIPSFPIHTSSSRLQPNPSTHALPSSSSCDTEPHSFRI